MEQHPDGQTPPEHTEAPPEKKCGLWKVPCSEARHDCDFWILMIGQEQGALGTLKEKREEMCIFRAILMVSISPKVMMGPPGGKLPRTGHKGPNVPG